MVALPRVDYQWRLRSVCGHQAAARLGLILVIRKQAVVVAFDYAFAVIGAVFLVCLPLVLLVRRGQQSVESLPTTEMTHMLTGDPLERGLRPRRWHTHSHNFSTRMLLSVDDD